MGKAGAQQCAAKAARMAAAALEKARIKDEENAACKAAAALEKARVEDENTPRGSPATTKAAQAAQAATKHRATPNAAVKVPGWRPGR